MPARQLDEEAIFNIARKMESADDRAAYLEQVCGDDPSLRARVEALLDVHEREPEFLEGPPSAVDVTVEQPPLAERPGTVIGRYKLLQEIGEGGFGVVFMAEQREPVVRKVALKIIKPGMDTKEVIARFEAERQALALMEHPNIAHVLDAGATASGRPYFVMELVKGIPLTDYCDQDNLGTRERLELFMDVCQAVHHAHQRGIIHRDIKPANILVTLHDGKPVVKVIDFGVAKATNQRLTERTLFTSFGQMVGTPLYMSPEQAALSGLDVDTRTDIYSLGVVLYELLTGNTPFDRNRLHSAEFDEVRRIIREEEPPRPSTKISTLGAEATTIASHRHTDPKRLSALVRGDLDWIVMKALEKDRNRRYDTAKDFAEDITRYLTHQPVEASPPSVVYRARKFVRRNRTALQVCAVILVLCGIVGGVFLRNSLERRREIAREEVREKLPEIRSLIAAEDYVAAWKRLGEAERLIPRDPMLRELWEDSSVRATVRTEPAGADVEFKPWNATDAEWISLGQAPLRQVRIPRGPLRWRFTKPSFSPAESLNSLGEQDELLLALASVSNGHEGMVHVSRPDEPFDFYIDKHEKTNREYAKFVDAGGYRELKYWEALVDACRADGKGDEGAKSVLETFVDKSGLPGPAGWANGTYPAGEADYPVTGVSWYEAAAYARFVGKELPTIHHWEFAASGKDAGYIIPLSNFSAERVASVGTYPGIGYFGVFDMAGNVKEWCWNASSDGARFVLGGAYYEPTYMFTSRDRLLPLTRSASVGFRCAVYQARPSEEDLAVISVEIGTIEFTPLTEEELATARKIFAYNNSASLNAETVSTDKSHESCVHETVNVDAAYGGERLTLHLFLPKHADPPYQTIVFFPGAGAKRVEKFSDAMATTDLKRLIPFVELGRAVCYPIYTGTFERLSELADSTHPAQAREYQVRLVQDLGRAVDYLASKPETFDMGALAYMGYSWGANIGPMATVVDGRFKACVLQSGGLSVNSQREISPASYAAHMTVPVLMLNGEQDTLIPVETRQKPLFEALVGTDKKEHRILPAGHGLPMEVCVAHTTPWLDGLFGKPLNIDIPADATPEQLDRYEKRIQVCLDGQLFDAAEERIVRLLDHRRARFGEEHRDTLRTKYLQANLRKLQDRPAEAMRLYEEALASQRAHLAPEDRDTKRTAAGLAGLYASQAWDLFTPSDNSPQDYEKACKLAERAMELDPEGKYRRLNLAWARYRHGDLEGASEMLQASAEYDDSWPGQYLAFAMVDWKLGRQDDAQAWYTAACVWIDHSNNEFSPVLQLRDEARQLLGIPVSTIDAPRVALSDHLPQDCPRGVLTSYWQERHGDLTSAELDLSVAVERHPESVRLLQSRSWMRVRLNRWKQAEEDLARLTVVDPDNHWYWYALSPLRLYLGDKNGYEEACRVMLEFAAKEADPAVGERASKVCCLVPVAEERRQLMCELADKALQANPEMAWMRLAAGIARYRAGDFAVAIRHLDRAIEINGGKIGQVDALGNLFLAMAWQAQENRSLAVAALRKAQAILYAQCPLIGRGQFAGSWLDWFNALTVAEEAGELVEGKSPAGERQEFASMVEAGAAGLAAEVDAYTKALETVPNDLGLLINRAEALGRLGRWDEVARDLRSIVDQNPKLHIYWLKGAYVLRQVDPSQYLTFCQDMRKRFGNPSFAMPYGRAIEASLLDPASVPDWKNWSFMAEGNLKKVGNPSVGHRKVMAGLACYRAHRFDDAIAHLKWAEGLTAYNSASAHAVAVLAMAYHAAGNTDRARQCLEIARQARKTSPQVQEGNLGPEWHDWLAHEILLREAEEALGNVSNQ